MMLDKSRLLRMTFMSHPTHTAECMPTRAEPYLYQHRYLFTVHPMMAAHCVCCGAQQSPQGPVLHPPPTKVMAYEIRVYCHSRETEISPVP